MEIWYVEDEWSPTLPENFYAWLSTVTTTVFLPERHSFTRLKDDIRRIYYTSRTPRGIELSVEFGYSLDLANKVMKCCEEEIGDGNENNRIIILINNGNRAIAHFLLQNSICKHDYLDNAVIILIQNDQFSEKENEIMFKFPYYWIKRKNISSIYSAHGIITLDKNVNNILNNSQKVLFLADSKNYSQIEDWMSTEFYLSVDGVQENLKLGSKLLSIIIPFYNMGSLLLETIESISNSTYSNFEIIIVNDGSDDYESIRILKFIESSYNSISIINIENRGLANARNVGVNIARGEFISFLDADDLVHPLYYERCIRVLDSYDNVSFVYSWVQFFGLRNDIWVTFDAEFPLILLSNMLSAFPVIRKKSFMDFGMNKMVMDKGMEDQESWISMMENGCKGVSIPEPLTFYRIRPDSMSRQFNRETVNNLFFKISKLHSQLYREYGNEIFNLIYVNGPGYLWNNPAINYPNVTYDVKESSNTDNQVKYELIRLINSKKGRYIVKWFFKLKLNRLFK